MKTMTDEELIDYMKNNPDLSANGRLVHEAITRIIVWMKKQGIKCGVFIYYWDESYWLHNMIDEYGDYTHLWKMQDYVLRFSQDVINNNTGSGET